MVGCRASLACAPRNGRGGRFRAPRPNCCGALGGFSGGASVFFLSLSILLSIVVLYSMSYPLRMSDIYRYFAPAAEEEARGVVPAAEQ